MLVATCLAPCLFAAAVQLEPARPGVLTHHPLDPAKGRWYGTVEYLPTHYDRNPTRRYPLILFFHGTGERGDGKGDLKKLGGSAGPLRLIQSEHRTVWAYDDEQADTAAIVVAMQMPSGQSPTPNKMVVFDGLVAAYCAARRVDPARILVTGLSMGGHSTWLYAAAAKRPVAALAPLSAGVGPETQTDYSRITAAAVWAHHGATDKVTALAASVAWIDGTLAAGTRQPAVSVVASLPGNGKSASTTLTGHGQPGAWRWDFVSDGVAIPGIGVPKDAAADRVRFTIWRNRGHDIFQDAYGDPGFWTWFLAQRLRS
jgi:predicted peptidase